MTLQFQEAGAKGAPTLIFLHGMTMGAWMWAEQIAAFSQEYHCLSLDLPSHGVNGNYEWVSLADSADQVATLIRAHATGGKAHLVGMSLGAIIGLHLMVRHTSVVQSALLSGVLAEMPPNQWLLKAQVRFFGNILRYDFGLRLYGRMLHITPEVWEVFKASVRGMTKSSWNRVYAEILSHPLPNHLESVQCQTLCVTGEADLPLNVRSVGIVVDKLPNASGWLAKGLHHGWNGENPQLFNAMLRTWLSGGQMPEGLIPLNG